MGPSEFIQKAQTPVRWLAKVFKCQNVNMSACLHSFNITVETFQLCPRTKSILSERDLLKTSFSTFRPLPVLDTIQTLRDLETKEAIIVWEANPDSYQDEYKITYYELENAFNGDSSSVYVADTSFSLSSLQPGRNYSISISAVAGSSDVSQEVESTKRTIYRATRKIGDFGFYF